MNVKQDESWERMNDKTVNGMIKRGIQHCCLLTLCLKTAMNDYVCEEYAICVCVYII